MDKNKKIIIPENHQPSGTYNYSKIDNMTLHICLCNCNLFIKYNNDQDKLIRLNYNFYEYNQKPIKISTIFL